ncbi:hypothetical protein THIOSC13_210011 [uncultured Thiomicrorhabdus sp.]
MTTENSTIDFAQFPDASGHFGQFGGIFAPETLMAALEQLNDEYESVKHPSFWMSWRQI